MPEFSDDQKKAILVQLKQPTYSLIPDPDGKKCTRIFIVSETCIGVVAEQLSKSPYAGLCRIGNVIFLPLDRDTTQLSDFRRWLRGIEIDYFDLEVPAQAVGQLPQETANRLISSGVALIQLPPEE